MSFLLRYDCENSRWKNKSHSLFLLVNLLQLQIHLSCTRFMLILLKVLLQYSRWENGRQRQTFKLLLLLLCSYLFQMFVDPFCESFLLYCISLVWKRGKINCVFSTSKYLKCSRNPFIGQNFSENLRLILLLALKFKKPFEMMQVTRLVALDINNLELLDQIFPKLSWLPPLSTSEYAWHSNCQN